MAKRGRIGTAATFSGLLLLILSSASVAPVALAAIEPRYSTAAIFAAASAHPTTLTLPATRHLGNRYLAISDGWRRTDTM